MLRGHPAVTDAAADEVERRGRLLYLVLGASPLVIRAFSGLTAARTHGAGREKTPAGTSGPLIDTAA
ncbi:hypothetical protein [Agromyces bauzanensis]|uniref:Uncharacterized protein n=1 Tax=Agromyces bauzanensis TaxID=1308924 RepID=A0A917PSW9_9MICO|nr:hypothetical protein [Agromyces bauzanensis]GGJ90348.1 hypothetical protein GCM10011372_31120 [Agromyces bauzanensis]